MDKSCTKKGGNSSPAHKGMPRTHKAACGKAYAIAAMRDRHNRQHHGGG